MNITDNFHENLSTSYDKSNFSQNESTKTATGDLGVKKKNSETASSSEIEIDKGTAEFKEIYISRGMRWFIFGIYMVLQIMMNVDHGTVPAATEEIRKDLSIEDDVLGMFASLVFLGNLIGSLISLSIINIMERKFILIISLVLNAFCLFTFGMTNVRWIQFANRIVVGIFQAYISIYLPVWCDQFGMGNKKSIMISLIQAGSTIGVVTGYFITFQIKKKSKWSFSFTLQSAVIIFIAFIIAFIPSHYFSADLILKKELHDKRKKNNNNRRDDKKDSNDIHSNKINQGEILNNDQAVGSKENIFVNRKINNMINDDDCIFVDLKHVCTNNGNIIDASDPSILNRKYTLRKFLKNMKEIFSEKVFVFSTIALSTLFFVITAVQYWSTDYMIKVLKVENQEDVLLTFSILCITSPTLGLILGGWACSFIGGYESKNSILLCFLFAFCAGPFSIIVPQANSLVLFAVFLWFVLFFGAAIFPTLTGIILSSLDPELRGLGNSINSFFANLFGYLPAPYVYGLINYFFEKKNDRMAFTGIMTYPLLCLVLVSIATFFRFKKFEKLEAKMNVYDSKDSEKSESGKTLQDLFTNLELIDVNSNSNSLSNLNLNSNDTLVERRGHEKNKPLGDNYEHYIDDHQIRNNLKNTVLEI